MALVPWKRRIVTIAGLQTCEVSTLRAKKAYVGCSTVCLTSIVPSVSLVLSSVKYLTEASPIRLNKGACEHASQKEEFNTTPQTPGFLR